MRWEDERYVRLYTRDTVDWLSLSFEAQGLLSLLLRKVDRAGVLALGKRGPKGVAAALGHAHRWDAIEPALEELLRDGVVEIHHEQLIFPNFLLAQECRQSDATRKRASRETARARALSADVATGPQLEMGPDTGTGFEPLPSAEAAEIPAPVTIGHQPSPTVTDGHSVPCRAVPSRAEPYRAEEEKAVASAATPVVLEKPDKPSELWDGDDFWLWAQWQRQHNGLLPERRKPRNLSAWYSGALMTPGVTAEALMRGFGRFGQSKHWEAANPPFPFISFVSQWEQFTRPEDVRHAAAS